MAIYIQIQIQLLTASRSEVLCCFGVSTYSHSTEELRESVLIMYPVDVLTIFVPVHAVVTALPTPVSP